MSSKVLYIAPFRDLTGYCYAARNTALALDAAGVEVVVSSVKLTGQTEEPPKRLQELETGDAEGCTHVIQHYLPHCMIYYAGMKNIGYFYCETSNFRNSLWQYHLNMMDEVWVSSNQNEMAARKSGVKVPIKVVDIPLDSAKYENVAPWEFIKGANKNTYVFYFIGDFSARKDLISVLRAYLGSFSRNDDVLLVIKSYVDGHASGQSMDILKKEIETVKAGLRLGNNYPKINLITDYLNDEGLNRLHASCDCFVTSEKGAAWNIPAHEALAHGNYVIAPDFGGQTRFLNKYNSFLLETTSDVVYGMDRCGYKGLYTAKEFWGETSILQISYGMRAAYQNKFKSAHKKELLEEFSLKNVGSALEELL